jgi:hypothetical protein
VFLLCRTGRGRVASEPVTGAFETVDAGVVNDSVDHRGGDGRVTEDVAPEPEGQVARHDQGCVFSVRLRHRVLSRRTIIQTP